MGRIQDAFGKILDSGDQQTDTFPVDVHITFKVVGRSERFQFYQRIDIYFRITGNFS